MAKKYMRMLQPTWMDGRPLKVDDIVELDDEEGALRWEADGLAKPSSEQAYRNQQRAAADLAAERRGDPPAVETAEETSEGEEDLITREDAPGAPPRRGR